jgi:hypothetical protein
VPDSDVSQFYFGDKDMNLIYIYKYMRYMDVSQYKSETRYTFLVAFDGQSIRPFTGKVGRTVRYSHDRGGGKGRPSRSGRG